MFTGWVRTMFTFQLIVYTTEISSVNKIVITEWLRLNISGFLMNGMHHRSTALFGSISYLSVVNIGRCNVSRGRGQGVEVEARTKQSPHGCIADDGSVRVKTECRPGS